jgi:hypothetical protein
MKYVIVKEGNVFRRVVSKRYGGAPELHAFSTMHDIYVEYICIYIYCNFDVISRRYLSKTND